MAKTLPKFYIKFMAKVLQCLDLQSTWKVYCRNKFVVFKLCSAIFLKLMEEHDHVEGNFRPWMQVVVVNVLSH
jgi:hypothetical protein